MRCPRCSKETNVSIMSKFNTQEICIECQEKEKTLPQYAEADRAEIKAVQMGNYNFEGIGFPAAEEENQYGN